MALLVALFLWLGFWQVTRLGEKELLISRVEQRAASDPIDLPPAAEWAALDPAEWDFRPVSLRGRFLQEGTVLVFTSLGEPRGQQSGPGYWVVTPFQRTAGGIVFVNRGFVPETQKSGFAGGGDLSEGEVEISGIARQSEPANPFTPPPEASPNIDYVRNVERLVTLTGIEGQPVAPLYIDQHAGAPGTLPQGGETRMAFPNRHLEYALTWFSLAALVPVMLLVWVFRNRALKKRPPQA